LRSNWFVITEPSAERKPGKGQDCVVAASLAGVVSGIGQGKITGHEQAETEKGEGEGKKRL
jgi:hypothetical protein